MSFTDLRSAATRSGRRAKPRERDSIVRQTLLPSAPLPRSPPAPERRSSRSRSMPSPSFASAFAASSSGSFLISSITSLAMPHAGQWLMLLDASQ